MLANRSGVEYVNRREDRTPKLPQRGAERKRPARLHGVRRRMLPCPVFVMTHTGFPR